MFSLWDSRWNLLCSMNHYQGMSYWHLLQLYYHIDKYKDGSLFSQHQCQLATHSCHKIHCFHEILNTELEIEREEGWEREATIRYRWTAELFVPAQCTPISVEWLRLRKSTSSPKYGQPSSDFSSPLQLSPDKNMGPLPSPNLVSILWSMDKEVYRVSYPLSTDSYSRTL